MNERRLPAWLAEPIDELLDKPWRDVILRASVLMFMFYATHDHELRMALRIVGTAMLFSDRFLHNRGLWLALTTVMGASVAVGWYRADNHHWLIAYWSLACYVAVRQDARGGAAVLAHNGRLLIGLCMAFAALWKVIGWQYLDGQFFLHQFQFDARFRLLTQLLGQPDEVTFYNLKVHGRLLTDHQHAPGYGILYTPALYRTAVAFGIWTILIEGLIAWAYLSPNPRWLHERRDWTLLLFIGTTYALAPVLGFGTILIVMGLASCDARRRRTRTMFLFAVVAVHLGNIVTTTVVQHLVA